MALHLPSEIITIIVTELGDPYKPFNKKLALAPLASINREWQLVVEGILWRKLTIHNDELEVFRARCTSVTRRHALRWLHVWFSGIFENGYDEDDDGVVVDFEDPDIFGSFAHRNAAFKHENRRFFQQVASIWEELASWGEELRLRRMGIYVEGESVYQLLGRSFREPEVAQEHLSYDASLKELTQLPLLPTVTWLDVGAAPVIDLWPAIVACKIANSLPNLHDFNVDTIDLQKTWPSARCQFRKLLGGVLGDLPESLRNIKLFLPFDSNSNHQVHPPSFLTDGVDTLSRAINHLSTNLSKLTICVNQISADLFWIAFSKLTLWPNLTDMHVWTAFETADGGYWMRGSDPNLPHHPFVWDYDRFEERDSDDDYEESDRLQRYAGNGPYRLFRDRPKPDRFDTLAISIARAASCMPKLKSITLEISARNENAIDDYQGWGFVFRSGEDARGPGTHKRLYRGCPGIDNYTLERPRTEWVFQCPSCQVQWEEPEEAKALWREKYPNIDMDIVTCERVEEPSQWIDADEVTEYWQRKRYSVGSVSVERIGPEIRSSTIQ